MKKSYIIAIIVLSIFFVQACRKDKVSDTTVDPVYAPTTYTLAYPTYINIAPNTSTGNPLTVEGVYLGRKLFYETMLSNDMTMSCNTCHKQENAFDDPQRFSKGTNGTLGTRNAMSLVNLAWNDRFFWDGRRNSLEGQAHDPVTNPIEMANQWPVVMQRLQASALYPNLFFKAFGTKVIDSDLVTKALAQFERTLISYNSRFDVFYYLGKFDAINNAELEGFTVFAGIGQCTNCHAGVEMTDHSFRNNGLDLSPLDSGLAKFTKSPADFARFKVPSLRNIALTAPYMHDGRFTTLDQVVDFYSDNLNAHSPNFDTALKLFPTGFHFTPLQKSNLVAFSKSTY